MIKYSRLITNCLIILATPILFNCSSDSPSEPELQYPGSWYSIGFEWAHDGNPYETEHFIVYSDAASFESRVTLANMGEELFNQLKTQMEIDDESILVYPQGQNKIHIYAYKNYFPTQWGGRAYFGGLMIYSLDHPERTAAGHTEQIVYEAVVKHELTHILQAMLIGRLDYSLVDSWFTEGIAEKISRSNPDRAVTTEARMDSLIYVFGELNPIDIYIYNYPDIENVGVFYYYPMFQLAANYLLDADGLGGTWIDVKNIFLKIREGGSFDYLFLEKFGMTITDFKSNFFNLMREYLP